MSAYGRIAVKIAHRIGDIQSRTVTIRNACSSDPPQAHVRCRFGRRAGPRLDRRARHASTSWKLFQTKITIGTIEIVSSTTAIAEP